MMASPKKPKKAFVQFAVATVIALVVGGIGLALLFLLFTGITANNEIAQQQHQEELKKKEKKMALLEKQVEQLQKQGSGHSSGTKKYTEVQLAVKVPLGTRLEESMLKEVELQPGHRPSMESFSRVSNVVGKISSMDLLPGEIITRTKLLDTKGMVPVTKGMRAVSIKVNDIASVDGAIASGMFVDVMATFPKSEMAKTLLQNVRVISSGEAPSSSPSGGKPPASTAQKSSKGAVTLEVTPAQAETLALANKVAEFHLALRGFGDKKETTLYGSDIGQLINGLSPADLKQVGFSEHNVPNLPNDIPVNYSENPEALPEPAVPEPENQTFQMEIYKGANSESKNFQWQY